MKLFTFLPFALGIREAFGYDPTPEPLHIPQRFCSNEYINWYMRTQVDLCPRFHIGHEEQS